MIHSPASLDSIDPKVSEAKVQTVIKAYISKSYVASETCRIVAQCASPISDSFIFFNGAIRLHSNQFHFWRLVTAQYVLWIMISPWKVSCNLAPSISSMNSISKAQQFSIAKLLCYNPDWLSLNQIVNRIFSSQLTLLTRTFRFSY